MQGTGAPLATPFAADGTVDHEALAAFTGWALERGLDFLVPTGSTSEAPLMTMQERNEVVETVVEESGDVPVMAGTGHPGTQATIEQTEGAAAAGADAALVTTPFFYDIDQAGLIEFYRDVADASPIPVYLYSVPKFTHKTIQPETVAELASHENVAGMKDSTGSMEIIQRTANRTEDEDFDLMIGAGSVYAPGLDAGAVGGVLAMANVVPELASEIRRLHVDGKDDEARTLNQRLVDLNRALTGKYGVPGVKAALQYRDAPIGTVRRPLEPVEEAAEAEIRELVDEALD